MLKPENPRSWILWSLLENSNFKNTSVNKRTPVLTIIFWSLFWWLWRPFLDHFLEPFLDHFLMSKLWWYFEVDSNADFCSLKCDFLNHFWCRFWSRFGVIFWCHFGSFFGVVFGVVFGCSDEVFVWILEVFLNFDYSSR